MLKEFRAAGDFRGRIRGAGSVCERRGASAGDERCVRGYCDGAHGAAGANGALGAEKPVRVVVSSDQLLQKLEGKLQQAAEKAVDSAMSARFSAAVNQAAKAIDDFSQSSVRKVQKQWSSTASRW